MLLVLLYYFAAWWMVGRDPSEGVVFPRFSPPSGISPALAKYIVNRGFGDGGWVALSAACLNLAVKKRLRLEETDGDTTLVLNRKGREGQIPGFGLPKGEAALEDWLSGRGSPLTLSKDNGNSIQALGKNSGRLSSGRAETSFQGEQGLSHSRVHTEPGYHCRAAGFRWTAAGSGRVRHRLSGLFRFCDRHFGQSGESHLPLRQHETAYGADLHSLWSRNIRGSLRCLPCEWWCGFLACSAVHRGGAGCPQHPVLLPDRRATAIGRQALDEIEGLRMYLSVAEKERLNMESFRI